jgi:hypothetical protein
VHTRYALLHLWEPQLPHTTILIYFHKCFFQRLELLDVQFERVQQIEAASNGILPPKFMEAKKAFLSVHEALQERALGEDTIDEVRTVPFLA